MQDRHAPPFAGSLAKAAAGALETAFGQAAVDHVIPLPGVMSRKKQVAPKLLAVI